MDNKRRKFLKMAGASVIAGIGAPVVVKLTSSTAAASASSGSAAPAAAHGEAGGHGAADTSASGLAWSLTCANFMETRKCWTRQ